MKCESHYYDIIDTNNSTSSFYLWYKWILLSQKAGNQQTILNKLILLLKRYSV